MTDVELATTASVPWQGQRSTTRHAAPASEGLLAGASKQEHRDIRRRRAHPAKPGRMDVLTTEQLVSTALAEMDATSAPDIAAKAGVGTDGRAVRTVIKAARETLAKNAERYAAAHAQVVEDALANGDAKSLSVAASAAQWAMERIAEGPDRVVDSPKQANTGTPGLRIGIAIGGIPGGTPAPVSMTPDYIDADALPALDAVAAELNTP